MEKGKALLLTLIILLAPFAGCLGEPESPRGTGTPPGAGATGDTSTDPGTTSGEDEMEDGNASDAPTLPWNVTAEGCVLLVAAVAFQADRVAAYLPTGFEPVPFAGGAPGTAQGALVVTRCSRALTPEGEIKNHQESLVYVYANPPDAYRVPEISNYRVFLRHGVASPDLVKAYAARNFSVEKVTTTAQASLTAPGVESIDARAAFSDLTFSFRGPVANSTGGGEVSFRLFTVSKRGVTGALDLTLAPFIGLSAFANYQVESGSILGESGGAAQLVHYDMGPGRCYSVTPAVLK
jgi:hypothetical protein